jgi:hypothetical protein
MRCERSVHRPPVRACTFCRYRRWNERPTSSYTPAWNQGVHIRYGSHSVPACAYRNDSAGSDSRSAGSPGNISLLALASTVVPGFGYCWDARPDLRYLQDQLCVCNRGKGTLRRNERFHFLSRRHVCWTFNSDE